MRIRQIYLEKLFGMFTYKIECNLQERITIIYGPNGYGKTTILKMIEALFKDEKSLFLKIPFSIFEITFDDNSMLQFKKKSPLNIEGMYKKNSKETIPFVYISQKATKSQSNEMLDKSTRIEKPSKTITKILPQPLEIISINTQRLFLNPKTVGNKKGLSIQSAVSSFSENLKNIIQRKLAESAGLSQSLDRSFPMRLVQQDNKDTMTKQEVQATLKQLEDKRKDLIEVGLLDKELGGFVVHVLPTKDIDAGTINVLSVYARDNRQKLAVFDEIYERIKLFKKIINERFLHKKISINRKDGFIFTSDQGEKLDLEDLSSGEKHEIVLIYDLLFNTNPDCLVLIDEPEISLHIAWQEVFLDNLLDIAKLRHMDVIIATHSPQIINDKWDLAVELKDLNA